MKRFSHIIQYAVLRLFSFTLCLLPTGIVYTLAKIMGIFTFDFLRIRRRVSLDNLRQALGKDKGEKELVKICRQAYENSSITFVELLLRPKMERRMLEKIVDMSELPVLQQAIARGRGAIVVSAHFGSWELVAPPIAIAGIPITGVATRQSNPYVDSFVNRHRIRLGVNVIFLSASAKYLVKAMKKHEVVGLISDQDAGRNGVFVDFFGRPASTPRGTAQLALKYDAPVIVCLTKRTSPGRYRQIVKEVKVLDNDTVETLTQRFTTIIEEIVRQYPEQYFWMHRRWKTRPTPNVR